MSLEYTGIAMLNSICYCAPLCSAFQHNPRVILAIIYTVFEMPIDYTPDDLSASTLEVRQSILPAASSQSILKPSNALSCVVLYSVGVCTLLLFAPVYLLKCCLYHCFEQAYR